MRLAIIDLGTNSARLDIYQIAAGMRAERIHREKRVVRLGERLFAKKVLHPDAIERTLEALGEFAQYCVEAGVERIIGLGTCALREAKNSGIFLRRVARELGFRIEIISGNKEAELILRGILQDEQADADMFGFVDIGGGSTEIGIHAHGEVIYLESFPFGAVRLKDLIPPPHACSEKIADMREIVRKSLDRRALPRDVRVPKLLGSSGTIRCLRNILAESGKGKSIKLKNLSPLIKDLGVMKKSELLVLPGMSPTRTDLIVPGAVILSEVMDFLGAASVRYTKYSLRDGVLARELQRLKHRA